MRRYFVIFVVLLTALIVLPGGSSSSAIPLAFTEGDGTPGNPYQISQCYHMSLVHDNPASSYKLMDDLTCPDFVGVASSDEITPQSPAEYVPIGDADTPFTGIFDGNNKTISNTEITITDTDDIGVFGVIGVSGVVKNLTLSNFNVVADFIGTGVLAGTSFGAIDNVHASGTVSGYDLMGGLVGSMEGGTISRSSAEVEVLNGGNLVGGLVGNFSDGTITTSYATGDVQGGTATGGFVGSTGVNATITNSYARGNANGGDQVAGFSGNNAGTISNSYSTGTATAGTNMGGFVGNADVDGTSTNSFWDVDTSNQGIFSSEGGTGKTTEEMTTTSTFTDAGWNFWSIWDRNDNTNDGYPTLRQIDIIKEQYDFTTPTGMVVGIEITGDCTIASLDVVKESANENEDIAYDYINGLTNFTLELCPPGASIDVRLMYYDTSAANIIVRKYNPTTGTYATVPNVTIGTVDYAADASVQVKYTIVDGGPLDSDGIANGTIVDPIGIAQAVLGAPQTGLGGTVQ